MRGYSLTQGTLDKELAMLSSSLHAKILCFCWDSCEASVKYCFAGH